MAIVSLDQLLVALRAVLDDKDEQGHDTAEVRARLEGPVSSVDTGLALSDAAARLPLRDGWSYDEPNDLAAIRAAADPHRVTSLLAPITTDDAESRVRAGFLGSVCGCILGKPVETDPTLDELRTALTAIGDWPLDDYISERLTSDGGFPRFNPTWTGTVRERIRDVAPDDDINYTLLGVPGAERARAGVHAAPTGAYVARQPRPRLHLRPGADDPRPPDDGEHGEVARRPRHRRRRAQPGGGDVRGDDPRRCLRLRLSWPTRSWPPSWPGATPA